MAELAAGRMQVSKEQVETLEQQRQHQPTSQPANQSPNYPASQPSGSSSKLSSWTRMAPVKVPSALCHERGPGIVDSSGEGGLVWNLDDSEKNR
ncbi:hypothetical protein CCUS01_07297 [Colletotrichum cuscutae]|uniref:Uncharacterized protein n=1 Tax=Colletotrichum cuscutae TaxID=1209917 RepID=A0AAI9V0Y5_9PEZI|nr:hypothetical protein CCUS01_07297 [Colletotrichum cuscutae]